MIPLSERFRDRIDSLFKSQQNRARQKRGPKGRISKRGYELPFDRRQFAAWFLDQFQGQENGVIRCRYCNGAIDAYSCVVDHAIPLKRGGPPGLSNLALLCEACNQTKGGMTPEEFTCFLEKMTEMAMQFHGGEAVKDICSRLQKAVKLAAALRSSITGQQKKAAAAVVGRDDNDF